MLLRALGGGSSEPDLQLREARLGDRYLLCSDGLWEMVRDEDIERIMLAAPDLNTACTQLVAAANQAGGEGRFQGCLNTLRIMPILAGDRRANLPAGRQWAPQGP